MNTERKTDRVHNVYEMQSGGWNVLQSMQTVQLLFMVIYAKYS